MIDSPEVVYPPILVMQKLDTSCFAKLSSFQHNSLEEIAEFPAEQEQYHPLSSASSALDVSGKKCEVM